MVGDTVVVPRNDLSSVVGTCPELGSPQDDKEQLTVSLGNPPGLRLQRPLSREQDVSLCGGGGGVQGERAAP